MWTRVPKGNPLHSGCVPTPSMAAQDPLWHPPALLLGPPGCNPGPLVPVESREWGPCCAACRRERAEVPAACPRGPKAPLPPPCPAGPLAASGCPQLVQAERRASPVRLGGAGTAVCERVGAAVVRVAALEPAEPLPLFTCVCTTALLKREGGWHRVVWFSVLSRLAGLGRRLVSVLSLSSREPWAFGSPCVWGRSGDTQRHRHKGVSYAALGWGLRAGRWQLFSPCLSPTRATGAAWLGGSFGLGAVVPLRRRLALSGVPCGGHRRAGSRDGGVCVCLG